LASPSFADAIASIESAGSGGYAAIGPTHPKYGRALGRYQVMESNLPSWSRQYLGREITPDEFLASKEAQDAIFNGEFGRLAAKHGPEGAARAWFAGEGGMNDPNRKDSLGTSVAEYGKKFNAAYGGGGGILPSQPAGEPMPITPQGILPNMPQQPQQPQQTPPGFALNPMAQMQQPAQAMPEMPQGGPMMRRPVDLRKLQAMIAQPLRLRQSWS
jgi:hypothetical protein